MIFSIKPLKKKSKKTFLILIGAVCLVIIGAVGLLRYFFITHNPNPTISSSTVKYSTDSPDETMLDVVCDNYKTAPKIPRKITIPAIDVDSCIQKVGVDQNKAIAAPTNIHFAGWYIDSSPPGDEGVSVIDGHVSGVYTQGIFSKLHTLKEKDKITIEQGDGAKYIFQVNDVKSYSVDDVMEHLFTPLNGVKSQLNLITCGGKYDQQTKTYEKRVVVRASLGE